MGSFLSEKIWGKKARISYLIFFDSLQSYARKGNFFAVRRIGFFAVNAALCNRSKDKNIAAVGVKGCAYSLPFYCTIFSLTFKVGKT